MLASSLQVNVTVRGLIWHRKSQGGAQYPGTGAGLLSVEAGSEFSTVGVIRYSVRL